MTQIPRPEYPRPQMVRDDWLNLNGTWEFEIDRGALRPRAWPPARRPRSPARSSSRSAPRASCPASATPTSCRPSGTAARSRSRPTGRDRRVLLHFGAVDYETEVWVNGARSATHRGGYVPFDAEITRAAEAGRERRSRSTPRTTPARRSSRPASRATRYESYGCFYTRTTGIWQTVWLEAVPRDLRRRR